MKTAAIGRSNAKRYAANADYFAAEHFFARGTAGDFANAQASRVGNIEALIQIFTGHRHICGFAIYQLIGRH